MAEDCSKEGALTKQFPEKKGNEPRQRFSMENSDDALDCACEDIMRYGGFPYSIK